MVESSSSKDVTQIFHPFFETALYQAYEKGK
jgi:hypothetical protein